MDREKLNGIAVAVFDIDGVLLDSLNLWNDIDIKFLAKRGYEPTAEYKQKIVALGNHDIARFTIDYYKLDDTVEGLSNEWTEMAFDAYGNEIGSYEGVNSYLSELYSSGVKLVAATSLVRRLAEAGLKFNGIDKYFDRIFISDEMKISKTSEQFYSYIASELGVSPQKVVVFDDMFVAVESARRAGMTAYRVCHGKEKVECGEINSFAVAPKICVSVD